MKLPAASRSRSRIGALSAAVLALCLAAPICAKPPKRLPTPRPVQAVAAPEVVRPALWKVSDADTTIYLFGTIHALPKGVEWFDGKVATAFEGSQELVTEVVETQPEQLQVLVATKAMLPKGQTLRGMLSPAEKLRFEATLTQYGLPVSAFDAFEPWYVAIGLATLPLLREGFTPQNGVEGVLDARGKAIGQPHSALETVEFQLGLFDSLPIEVQKRYLGEVIDQLPEMKAQLTQMIAAWKSGDAQKLADLVNSAEDDPAMMETLLISRNRTWASWIKDRLARPGAVFVAVGAGHLAGPGSVQDQLSARGIRTTRLQ